MKVSQYAQLFERAKDARLIAAVYFPLKCVLGSGNIRLSQPRQKGLVSNLSVSGPNKLRVNTIIFPLGRLRGN